MKDMFQVIKRPLLTEKSTRKKEEINEVAFEVDRRANRSEVKMAVQALFKVKVQRVNLMQLEGKKKRVGKKVGRTADWKKALVRLAPGEAIENL
ncbi:MAG: 50S ribosomal protein L23 [Desulfobacca sp.]|jgi:large subunit ribosomal protein L23|nr:50S ribosomal protein L23 [Desulfobacca sp.]